MFYDPFIDKTENNPWFMTRLWPVLQNSHVPADWPTIIKCFRQNSHVLIPVFSSKPSLISHKTPQYGSLSGIND